MLTRLLLLVFGVFACSTAVIMIKESLVPPVLLAGLRQLTAALILTPIFLRDVKRNPDFDTRANLRKTVLPGIILGIHFISWIIGARLTLAANSSLIVNLVPVVMPFFLIAMFGEKLTRREILCTLAAVGGMFLLTASDFNLSAEYFWGDLLCLGSMLFFAFYLALARKNSHFPSIWLYLVPLYYVGGLFCLLGSLFFEIAMPENPGKEALLILALGIVPTVIGHSTLNYSMKHMRGQVVSIVNMAQFIFSGIMAYAFFTEIPGWTFYAAGAVLIASSLGVITESRH